ncbi:primosome assembly protein PriA [compost metagenome]
MQASATKLQKRASTAISNLFASGETTVLVQAMTGAGKTYIGFDFIRDYLFADASRKVQIVVPTVALVEQFHETAEKFGFLASVYHGELTHRTDENGNKVKMEYLPHARINITLPDTFANLINGQNLYGFDMSWKPTLLMMDEAHKNTSASSQEFKKWAPEALVLGFTATPRREQNETGEYLIDWYGDNLLIAATPEELIEAGRIVPPSIHEYRDTNNEFDEWEALTAGHSNKSTMVVAKDTAAAVAYVDGFRKRFPKLVVELITSVGCAAAGIAQQTTKQRQELQSKFKRGLIDVLVSVDTLCEGFDAPRAKFVMIMRSMTSEALYHQVVGRVLRMFTCAISGEAKTHGYVMDFGGNHKKYGAVTERVWTPKDYAPLISIVANDNRVTPKQFSKASTLMISCNVCQKVYDAKSRATCPACKQAHKAFVEVYVKDFIQDVYGLKSQDFIQEHHRVMMKNLFSSKVASKFLPDGSPDMTHGVTMFRTIMNDQMGHKVFLDTGLYDPAHKYLAAIFLKDAKLGNKLNIPLADKVTLALLAA